MHKGIYLYECPGCANHTIVNFQACHLCGTPNDFEDRTHKSFVLKPLSEACIADLVLLYEAQAAIQNKQDRKNTKLSCTTNRVGLVLACCAGSCLFMTGSFAALKFVEGILLNLDKLPEMMRRGSAA